MERECPRIMSLKNGLLLGATVFIKLEKRHSFLTGDGFDDVKDPTYSRLAKVCLKLMYKNIGDLLFALRLLPDPGELGRCVNDAELHGIDEQAPLSRIRTYHAVLDELAPQ